MPADYAVITALSETSDAFARSVRVSTLLADAEVTTRARMPVVIGNYVGAYTVGQQPPTQIRDRFLQTLSELEAVAEDASMTFCIFTAALTRATVSSSRRLQRSRARSPRDRSRLARSFKAAPRR